MNKFQIKTQLDNIIYKIFNFASDFAFSLNIRLKNTLKKNLNYRNLHRGQRCFICGTGPSLNTLTTAQLEALKKEVIFATNSFYKATVLSELTPKYYTLIDNNYWQKTQYTFSDIYEKYKIHPPTFITATNAENHLPQGAARILTHAKNYPVKKMRFDMTGNMSISMNVVGHSILSAIFMGFKEIYLLGCDYNLFCSRVGIHCYDDSFEFKELPTYNLSFYLKYYHITTEFHYLIAQLAAAEGVKIINISKGSLLDAYPHNDPSIILS